MRLIPIAIVFCAVAALSGCSIASDPTDGVVCTAQFVFGVNVKVLDSLTNTPAATGAKLVARSGTFADSSSATIGDMLSAAGEHAGTFTLTVSKAGYKDWVKSGVVVTTNECHVIPVSLTALLQK